MAGVAGLEPDPNFGVLRNGAQSLVVLHAHPSLPRTYTHQTTLFVSGIVRNFGHTYLTFASTSNRVPPVRNVTFPLSALFAIVEP